MLNLLMKLYVFYKMSRQWIEETITWDDCINATWFMILALQFDDVTIIVPVVATVWLSNTNGRQLLGNWKT